ncbi:DUF3093 family protein [Gandjariella thermophila]|uniref:DUF3093 domain-containing protein n=1 Tax=Gandjariella thermophila TaxID=1931992 RepID=A0A4D4J2T0_9PSEU|nr:DUF3093 family protein [Gandjariella thermophila]GDY29460.1 hypothetical protein GTS_10930 [Gandjariella thermophila]
MSTPTASDEPQPTLYTERGSTWWPVLWGPAFALIGLGAEVVAGAPHVAGWLLVGLALAVAAAVWVNARSKVYAVRLTPVALRQGREELPVARVAEVDDVGAPVGARVLGGGWAPPRGTTALPVRLDDGSVVLAWARDVDALREALRPLVRT